MKGWRNKATRFSKNSGRGAQRRAARRNTNNLDSMVDLEKLPAPTVNEPVMTVRQAPANEDPFVGACLNEAKQQLELDVVGMSDAEFVETLDAHAEHVDEETADERKKRLKRESAARSRAKKKAEAQQLAA